MDNAIFTIGYGNDPPEAFLKRLTEARINLVIDVRREGSGARLGCYAPSKKRDRGMFAFLLSRDIHYIWASSLGNQFRVVEGRSAHDCLNAYSIWLMTELKKKKMQTTFFYFMWRVKFTQKRLAFLCAEKKVMKNGGWNCHRGIVAEKMADVLGYGGDEWSVKHL